MIPVDAHIRLASRKSNNGIQILRRGYSFTDGIDPVRGHAVVVTGDNASESARLLAPMDSRARKHLDHVGPAFDWRAKSDGVAVGINEDPFVLPSRVTKP